jgi:transcriptional regulator with XRE-family HTH domain
VKRLLIETVQRDLGRRVAELRAARELTQEALAETLDFTPRYLQRVEAGRENLTLGSLVAIANALGVPLAELLEPPTDPQVRVGRPPVRRPDPPSPTSAGGRAAVRRPRTPRPR